MEKHHEFKVKQMCQHDSIFGKQLENSHNKKKVEVLEKYESWLDIDWLVLWNAIELIIFVSSTKVKHINI